MQTTQGTQGTAISDAEDDIDALQVTQGTQGTAISDAEDDIDALEGRADVIESDVEDAEADIATLEEDVSTLQTDLGAAESDIDDLEDLIPIETFFITNDAQVDIAKNTEEEFLSVDILDGETIEIQANVCLKREPISGKFG